MLYYSLSFCIFDIFTIKHFDNEHKGFRHDKKNCMIAAVVLKIKHLGHRYTCLAVVFYKGRGQGKEEGVHM